MKIIFRKLKRLKHLAGFSAKSPIEKQLDEFWGLTPASYKSRRKRKYITSKKKDVKIAEDISELESSDQNTPVITIREGGKGEKSAGSTETIDCTSDGEAQKQIFKDTVKEIRKLVYPHLDPITKRHYDETKLIALCGRVAKNRKMPYKEYMMRQRALKRHVEKNKRLESELGVKLFLDTKAGARSAQLQKKRLKKGLKSRKSLFDDDDRNGIHYIYK